MNKNLRMAAITISAMAEQHGVPESQLRKELAEAMDYAINNPDPTVREQIKAFSYSGSSPTVEEFILWITEQAKTRLELIRTEN